MFDMNMLPAELQDWYKKVDAAKAEKRDGVMQRASEVNVLPQEDVWQEPITTGAAMGQPRTGEVFSIGVSDQSAVSANAAYNMSDLLARLEGE